ncbi:MAG: hypothetical protein V1836_01435 [Candidatus Aenigmatarchaeota archaeon]
MASAKIAFIFAVILFLMTAGSSSADGILMSKESGGFLFELGVPSATPVSSDKVTMTMVVKDAATGSIIIPDELHARISKPGYPLFPATSFEAKKDTVAFFRYEFPESGNYQINFVVVKADNSGNVTFDFSVSQNSSEPEPNPIYMMAVVIAVVIFVVPIFIVLISKL